jgi:hypothetical protein
MSYSNPYAAYMHQLPQIGANANRNLTPPNKPQPDLTTLYVRGFPSNTREEDVMAAAQLYGQVKAMRFQRNKDSVEFNGYAFVNESSYASFFFFFFLYLYLFGFVFSLVGVVCICAFKSLSHS